MQTNDNGAQENSLSLRQQKAISLLITRPTRDAVLKELELSSHTLYRWMRDPAFKEELSRLQNEVIKDAMNVLRANMTKAADTLVSLLDDKRNPELRRRVANDIISHVLKAKELEEIEERLEQVERVVLERKTYK